MMIGDLTDGRPWEVPDFRSSSGLTTEIKYPPKSMLGIYLLRQISDVVEYTG